MFLRTMPQTLLTTIMLAAAVARGAAPATQPAAVATNAKPIRVAVFMDAGASDSGQKVLDALAKHPEFVGEKVTAEDIQKGALDHFDVMVQGGGSGSKQAKTLGPDGCAAIKKFVNGGGGYLGICAGAYLASADYSWSLHLLNAKVVDKKDWARGDGQVKIKVDPTGQKLLQIPDQIVDIRYAQGPLLAPGNDPSLPAYIELATFQTEMRSKGNPPPGVMIGTTAMAAGTYGKGRVFCSSPHPERQAGLDYVVRNAIDWLAGKTEMPIVASIDAATTAPAVVKE
jgi:glutamine amidotransferase-like uncharacterized protein